METVDDALAAFIICFAKPYCTSQQSLIGTLKDLGVEKLEDFKHVQEADLSEVLRPTEAIKLISPIRRYTYCQ